MPLWRGEVFVFLGLVAAGISSSACFRTKHAKPDLPALERACERCDKNWRSFGSSQPATEGEFWAMAQRFHRISAEFRKPN